MPSRAIDLDAKKAKALAVLRDSEAWLIALSGGVDSAVLLALAVEAVGADRVTAATATSAAVTEKDLASAGEVAARLGVSHRLVPTGELDRPEYRANRGDRCFHCRDELFERLRALEEAREGGARLAYGAITDDLGDDRPGMRAAALKNVAAPLLEAGLGKEEVRSLAREAGLSVAERPANACLASRIPVGTEVTAERLRQVDRAERALEALGIEGLRVRHHGDLARIEVPLDRLDGSWLVPERRERLVQAIQQAGFRFVTIDLQGYRPGGRAAAQRSRPARPGGQ